MPHLSRSEGVFPSSPSLKISDQSWRRQVAQKQRLRCATEPLLRRVSDRKRLFTPQSSGVGQTVTILGQRFSATPASNTVSFNGAAATVVSATTTTLATATTGPISVTVAGIPSRRQRTSPSSPCRAYKPSVQMLPSANPQSTNIPNLQLSGANLTGSTFSFSPVASPAAVTVNSATCLYPDGNRDAIRRISCWLPR